MNNTCISVILPVYNGIKYLEESVQSVINQNLENFELLILDDCSNDGSWEYLNSLTDSRISLFRNESNKGLFYNLNFLIKKTNSPLIKLWSQDDYMTPDSLKKVVDFYNKNAHVGLIYTAVKVIDKNSNLILEAKEDITPEIVDQATHAKIAFRWGSIAGNIANVTLSAEAIKKVGLFDVTMKISGDFDMWVRIAEYYSIGFINEPLVYLRSHTGQLSRQEAYYLNHVSEDITVYKKLFSYLSPDMKVTGLSEMRQSKLLFYYTLMLHALRKNGLKDALRYWRTIKQFDNPFILTYFYIKIKIFRIN